MAKEREKSEECHCKRKGDQALGPVLILEKISSTRDAVTALD